MAKKVSLSNEHLEIDEIAEYKNDLLSSIVFYYENATNFDKFKLYTNNEIKNEKKKRLLELELNCIFMVLSSIESLIRIDYETRVRNKQKNSLARDLRELDKNYDKTYKIPINTICDIYKNNSQGELFSFIKSIFKLRHWLAHGRYWTPKIGRKYDFDDIYNIAYELNNLLKNY